MGESEDESDKAHSPISYLLSAQSAGYKAELNSLFFLHGNNIY